MTTIMEIKIPMKIGIFSFFLLLILQGATVTYSYNQKNYEITSSTNDITVSVNESQEFYLEFRGNLSEGVNLTFLMQHDNIIDLKPEYIYLESGKQLSNHSVTITGCNAGHLEVTVLSTLQSRLSLTDWFLRVTVLNSWIVYYISVVIGWIYFLSWSISFYPQIYSNFIRKSVVGLNFDFLTLNFVGFTLYSVFNIGLFLIPEIQHEYSNRYPRGVNPVLINDVVFSLHAMFATFITIIQCVKYERADQRVSRTTIILNLCIFVSLLVLCGLAAGWIIHWLDFFYVCSYIKLGITLIKYIPQAVMNYRRKSTVGWSIGNILLDFIGGVFSMLQMLLNGYNYDDWASLFGDPTKFGLGLFSVCFDIFFMLQHYVFYRQNLSSNTLCNSETTTFEGR